MREFQLKQKGIELKIEGNVFRINPEDPEFIEKLLDFKKKALVEKEKLANLGGDNYVDALRQATQFTTSTIDAILGEGSCDKIFDGKKIAFTDTLDIIAFIQDEASNKHDQSMEKYTEFANRAQRRAALKDNK